VSPRCDPIPARYDEVSRAVDTLVIGAGAAGCRRARCRARAAHVLLLEGAPRLAAGSRARTLRPGGDAAHKARIAAERSRRPRRRIAHACTAFGLYDHGSSPRSRRRERASASGCGRSARNRIILATGAFERPLLFPDNDRPGVMLAGAVERYATHFGVACGKRVRDRHGVRQRIRRRASLRARDRRRGDRRACDRGGALRHRRGVPCYANRASSRVEAHAPSRA
jgi:sarcosine oxidase subunit alpha